MATTLNGLIAGEDDTTGWISEGEWNSYSQQVRDAGCMIIGRRTYEILTTQPEFSEFAEVTVVVVTSSDLNLLSTKHSTARSPAEALEKLKDNERVIIAGGGILNGSFLAEGLIDEIYLDIEPFVMGKGVQLFSDHDFQANLELIEVNKLSSSEVQLHYKIVR